MNNRRLSWNLKQLVDNIGNGKCNLSHPIQRGDVWDKKRKSLLIHSIVMDYPIGSIYVENRDGSYYVLDGKQRCLAIYDFLFSEFRPNKRKTDTPEVKGRSFRLVSVPEKVMINDKEYDFNGKLYEELDDAVKDKIIEMILSIDSFSDASADDIKEIFFRLNNGKSLSAIAKSRTQANDLESIRKLSEHDLFKDILSKSAIDNFQNDEIVIKTIMVLNGQLDLIGTNVQSNLKELSLTEKELEYYKKIFDKILSVIELLKEDKEGKKPLGVFKPEFPSRLYRELYVIRCKAA